MKRKYYWLLIILSVISAHALGQNKIGDNPTSVQAGSLLELESATKGLRLPRIVLNDSTQWAPLDGTPVSGMLIFNESGRLQKGLYYWSTTASKWMRVISMGDLTNLLSIKNGVLTSTIIGVTSNSVNVLDSAQNGLTSLNGKVSLGGTLNKPTTIKTDSVNTIAIAGLKSGDLVTDSVLVANGTTGTVKRIDAGRLIGGSAFASVYTVNTDGEQIFSTPVKVADMAKIQVYRNGVNVKFTKDTDYTIKLEDAAICFKDDEIKIVQLR